MEVLPDVYIAEYFNTAKCLTELFTSSFAFTCRLGGLGYDGVPVCFCLGSSVDDGSLEESFASSPQPCGKQWATFVHSKSVVLQNDTTQYKERYPLLFYTSPGPKPGTLQLWMSSRTHCLILRNNYGLPLAEATRVHPDQHNSPRFHLSAKWLMAEIKKTLPKNVLLVNPLEDMEKCDGKSSFSHKRDIGEVNEYLRSIYSVKIQPGFVMAEWPMEARDWLSRQRSWPDRDTINKASQCEVRIVPQGQRNHSKESNSDEVREDLLDHWMYDFSTVEQCLLEAADASKCKILLISQVFLYQLSDPNMAWHDVLKPAFLWYLEKHHELDLKDANSVLKEVKSFLKEVKEYFDVKMLPGYFLPEMNVFDGLLADEVEEMSDTVAAVLARDDEEIEVLLLNYLQNNDQSLDKLSMHLKQSFDRLVSVLYLQLYHRLHSKSNLDDAVALHREMLHILVQSDTDQDVVAPLKDIIMSSLGSLLMVKAGHAYLNKEKRTFASQGEDYMKLALGMDALAGRVKLAAYLYFKKEYADVLKLLQPVMNLTETSSQANQKCDPGLSTDQFKNFLLSDWKNQSYMLETLYSVHEKPFAPDEMTGSTGLMEGQVLGYVPNPVATANTRFLAVYLYAQSLIQLGQGSEVKAAGFLTFMETEAEKEQDDMNEKRSVVYLNLLSHVYFHLEDRATGIGMLRKSMTILSNPRNPARWKLFVLRTERTRKYLTWGALAFAASTLTAMALRCVKPGGT